VGWPGSGFNNIAVGSLGGNNFLVSSDFSARGLNDFYNPVTGTVVTNARVAVDIAAPGDYMVLAAYLGDSGGIGASTNPAIRALIQQPSPTNQYFLNMDGTSFSAPIVAGGIALLKDVAKTHPFLNLAADTNALDTRVVKSVIMAGARETFAWDNGQNVTSNGVVRTTRRDD
jgi:subtilisin family serine protease